jgi:hypothetical protein
MRFFQTLPIALGISDSDIYVRMAERLVLLSSVACIPGHQVELCLDVNSNENNLDYRFLNSTRSIEVTSQSFTFTGTFIPGVPGVYGCDGIIGMGPGSEFVKEFLIFGLEPRTDRDMVLNVSPNPAIECRNGEYLSWPVSADNGARVLSGVNLTIGGSPSWSGAVRLNTMSPLIELPESMYSQFLQIATANAIVLSGTPGSPTLWVECNDALKKLPTIRVSDGKLNHDILPWMYLSRTGSHQCQVRISLTDSEAPVLGLAFLSYGISQIRSDTFEFCWPKTHPEYSMKDGFMRDGFVTDSSSSRTVTTLVTFASTILAFM